ncbi:YbfB/YjiJ family MFS transporter [Siminovitchia sp. FSL W7-1587]|uniref:YbfB/YjiJ family MFS transporter n=1 Tax=Siminovitchia sp. FSL W7-1587 TaxID=2954699 RepID=UPI0030D4A56C
MLKSRMLLFGLVSMFITICTSGFARMSYGILMPFMKDSLSLTYKQAGMLGTSTALGYLGMVLFVGIMTAKWGSKRLIIIGTFFVAAGLMYLYVVNDFLTSLIGMVVLGVGTAFVYTPMINLLVGWFPQNRGVMIGFAISGMGLGTLISSMLVPHFTSWFADDGWRYLWLLFGILSIAMGIIGAKTLEDAPNSENQRDTGGVSIVQDVYFHKGVLLVGFMYGLLGFAYLIPQSFLFSYIMESGMNRHSAGQIMALGGLMSIVSGPLWGAISDKIGRKRALLINLFIAGISILIPIFLPVLSCFFISQFFWGLTFIGMLSLSQALSTEQIDESYAPIALGYVTIFFGVGQILGPGLGGIIIDRFGSIPAALWLCFGLIAAAFLLGTRLAKAEIREWQNVKEHSS